MIQEEFKDMVFRFARHASVDDVAYIFLFGSVAKGDADRRSDIDILVVFDTYSKDFENLEAKSRISELALTLEKEYDKNIQVVFTNKNYEGLQQHFIEEVFKNGILLYVKSPSIIVGGLELENYAMIAFSLDKLSTKDKMKVKRTLYGLKTKKVVKGRFYKSEKMGLVQQLQGIRIGAGVLAVPQKNVKMLEEKLNKLKLTFKVIDLWLTKDNIRKLGS
ncbi:MAG: nucleotidyltransferase domain-containing protein [Candidatus Omnitrophota bacterium]